MGHRFFYSFFVLLVSFFCLLLGTLAMILPWSTAMKTSLFFLLEEERLLFSLSWSPLILIGAGLLTLLFVQERRSTIHLSIGENACTLDSQLISSYLQTYWEKMFPDQRIPFHWKRKGERISLHADLPCRLDTEKEILSKRIQNDLSDLFETAIGWEKPIDLHLHFPSS